MAQSRGDIVLHKDKSPSPLHSLECLRKGGSHRSDLAEYYGRGGGDLKPEELSRQPEAVAAQWWDPHALLCIGSSVTWFGFGLISPPSSLDYNLISLG